MVLAKFVPLFSVRLLEILIFHLTIKVYQSYIFQTRLGQVLGKGSYGTVFLATKGDTEVSVKVSEPKLIKGLLF